MASEPRSDAPFRLEIGHRVCVQEGWGTITNREGAALTVEGASGMVADPQAFTITCYPRDVQQVSYGGKILERRFI